MNDPRILKVFILLSLRNEYVSAHELASSLNISLRTLRELIRENKDEIEMESGANLIYKNNFGYALEVEDPAHFHAYLEQAHQALRERQYALPDTAEGRVEWIIRQLLVEKNPVRIDDLADQLYVSRSTLVQDLKVVREILNRYCLQLNTKPRGGLVLSGSEKSIRNCISDYYFYDFFHDSQVFEQMPLGQFARQYQPVIQDVVRDVLHRNQYKMTDVGMHNLVIHILIALFRNQKNIQKTSGNVVREEDHPLEFAMCREISFDLEKRTGFVIPVVNYGYMVIHMLGTRVFEAGDERLITAETINLVRLILNAILVSYGIDFFADIELFTMLCTHIEPMMERLLNDVKMRNPLLQGIKQDNPVGYDLAAFSCNLIAKKYHVQVDENEIGYLALHFSLALERRKQMDRKNVLVVCASGIGISKMMKYRIQQLYGERIEHLETAGVGDLDGMNLDTFDLIISTIPLSLKTTARIIVVQYNLTPDDQREVEHAFAQDETLVSVIHQVFDKDLYFEQLDESFDMRIIHALCTKLKEKITVPDTFEARVIAREKLSSTVIGNGVAMPHPDILMLDESKVVVAHLKKPVQWGNDKVNWVFLLGIAKQESGMVDQLLYLLYERFKDKYFWEEMGDHPDFEKFIQCLCRAADSRETKQESIFR